MIITVERLGIRKGVNSNNYDEIESAKNEGYRLVRDAKGNPVPFNPSVERSKEKAASIKNLLDSM